MDAIGPYDVVAGEVLDFLVSLISSSASAVRVATVEGHQDYRVPVALDALVITSYSIHYTKLYDSR